MQDRQAATAKLGRTPRALKTPRWCFPCLPAWQGARQTHPEPPGPTVAHRLSTSTSRLLSFPKDTAQGLQAKGSAL